MSLETVKGRVLFTGNGQLIIDNLTGHMPNLYQMQKCQPIEVDFTAALKKFRPHTIVVCLLDEIPDALRMYYLLEQDPRYQHIPVIAIGKEDDCELFRRKVLVRNLTVMPRPLDQTRFLKCLDGCVETTIQAEKEMPPEELKTMAGLNLVLDAVPEAPAAEKVEKNPMNAKKVVLVVDDDTRMLNVIKLYLQDFYEISVVPSGKLALKFLSKKPCDLVLLDYIMPEMDGPAVLKEIRETTPNPDIPVIFLTGVSDKDLVMRGLEYHPAGYMLKPVTRETLLEKVMEVLMGL